MSSKRAQRRKSCTSKRRFATQEEAASAAFGMLRAQGRNDTLTAYHCKFCNGYHFGHPPRRVRQAIAAKGKS